MCKLGGTAVLKIVPLIKCQRDDFFSLERSLPCEIAAESFDIGGVLRVVTKYPQRRRIYS